MVELIIENAMQIVAVIGILAFLVSLIVQLIKSTALLDNVPTSIVVMVLSVILTVLAYCAYCACMYIVIEWYMIVAAFVCGFVVAYVAMYGWDNIKELYDRFKK